MNIIKNVIISVFSVLLSNLANAEQLMPRALISDDYPNTQTTAKEIPFNTLILGSNEFSGDEDWFTFTVSKSAGFHFIMSTLNRDSGYPYFVLYDNNLTELHKEMFSTSGETVSLNLSQGMYYIKLYQYNGNTTEYKFIIKTEQISNAVVLDSVTIEYCKNNPAVCGISTVIDTNGSTEEGIAQCKNSPGSCGISISSLGGYTQEQMMAAENSHLPLPISLSPKLGFHLNELILNTVDGKQKLWANFNFVPDKTRILFEASSFGDALGNDQDQDDFSIEEGDCNDTNATINPGAEEILNDGIDQDCESRLDD